MSQSREDHAATFGAACGMRPRTYAVLARAVEDGVSYGWQRAHKHSETPDAETVMEQIIHGVLTEICEWFEDVTP